jgi:hypothetical protein
MRCKIRSGRKTQSWLRSDESSSVPSTAAVNRGAPIAPLFGRRSTFTASLSHACLSYDSPIPYSDKALRCICMAVESHPSLDTIDRKRQLAALMVQRHGDVSGE